jgi:ribosome-binding factor A
VRNWLRQHLDLRVTPEIDFRADRSMEHAAKIQSLLKQVQEPRD